MEAHRSVLLQESIEGLDIQRGDTYVDATINGGGHAVEVAKRFGNSVSIIGIDADRDALENARLRLSDAGAHFALFERNFRDIDTVLRESDKMTVERILFDLGWSSVQFEHSGRGFSFMKDEPLVMTFKKDPTESDMLARDIVNNWQEENIVEIIRSYGEERFAGRIARWIVLEREKKAIETTGQLVEIIRRATPFMYHHTRLHFATRTFQALRIAVNDEMIALKDSIGKAFWHLAVGGRIAIITFHSIEDRIVKHAFRDLSNSGRARLVNKKPIIPTDKEIDENRRSRSAKLRIIEKIAS